MPASDSCGRKTAKARKRRAIPTLVFFEVRLKSLVFVVFDDNAYLSAVNHSRAWPAPTGGLFRLYSRHAISY
jgi:hypothetical protein